jgi:hypothetical protein
MGDGNGERGKKKEEEGNGGWNGDQSNLNIAVTVFLPTATVAFFINSSLDSSQNLNSGLSILPSLY